MFQRLRHSLTRCLVRSPVILLSCSAAFAAPLDWQVHETHRRAPLSVPASGKTGFTELDASAAGIQFTNSLSEHRSLTNQIFLNGSGVAAGDVDGDGLCDLYFCGLDSPNRLYRNLGNWRFRDITGTAGVACADQASTGAVLADIDGDSDLDLLVTGIARGVRLFLNDGNARFRETTADAGLSGDDGSTTLALADIDGNGSLDLYVVNYRNDTMRDMPDLRFRFNVKDGAFQLLTINGQPAAAPQWAGRFTFDRLSGVLENGQPDALYRNDGHGRFTRLSWTSGVFLDETGQTASIPYDWGLSAMFRDLNGDRAPDLYVCNDFQSPDRIWINDGHGRFRAIPLHAVRQTSLFSMGVDAADLNQDGYDDLFIADMLSLEHPRRQVQVMDAAAFAQFRNTAGDRPQFPRNTLLLSRGNGTYAEIAQFAGLDASDWSWCPAFLDADLDGHEDLLVTTGHWRDAQNVDVSREIEEAKKQKPLPPLEELRLRRRFPRLDTPNVAFRNQGDLTFKETGQAWGFASRRISQGMALADLDNDGDLDVVINCLNDPPLLYRNESPRPRLAVRLRGAPPNTQGIGARVRVRGPGLPDQIREFVSGGRYLSGDDSIRVFAAGNPTNRLEVEVFWRSGRTSLLTNLPANSIVEIREPTSPLPHPPSTKQETTPFFQDVSSRLAHTHVDLPFDDFARQPLLPRKLSELGPGVAWFDFNRDGWDDLFIGSGAGGDIGQIGVFRNNAQGGFVRQRAALFGVPLEGDTTTILGWESSPSELGLLIGLSNNEPGRPDAPALRFLSVTTGAQRDDLLRSAQSFGPLAMADVDQDGDLDLFAGARAIPMRYPEPASSALLRNENGRLVPDASAAEAFNAVGLVSGARFSDLDADGQPELILACDWGPLRIFRNRAGRPVPWDPPVESHESLNQAGDAKRLSHLTGWWNSVATGDFDNDGRLDIVAGNWGRNTARRRFLQGAEPLRLYFESETPGPSHALLETGFDPGRNASVPLRDFGVLAAAIPALRGHFRTFTQFSTATVADLRSRDLLPKHSVTAATLDSVILLNRGDHFSVRPLPPPAQFSPVFGIAVGDLDGNGTEDLFLAQNFFGVSPAESRHDAGCGLWLRGDGQGGFVPVPPAESGFEIDGEARGAALADFDHDGRVDLLVGQNQGHTKLYRNQRARPGLRIRLQGPPANPRAIGSILRLRFKSGRTGPVREVHLGSGYWSQDSAEVVLALPEEPDRLEIRWPDGSEQSVPVPADHSGFLQVSPH